jgi:hypothetical protein
LEKEGYKFISTMARFNTAAKVTHKI